MGLLLTFCLQPLFVNASDGGSSLVELRDKNILSSLRHPRLRRVQLARSIVPTSRLSNLTTTNGSFPYQLGPPRTFKSGST